MQRLC